MPYAFQRAIAGMALLLLLPLMGILAIIILLTEGRPILFRQKRVGQHGRLFTMYKFRTMRNASYGPDVTVTGDYRITPLGRRLRNAKVDELPQLVNVLTGQMALVGPRPEIPQFVRLWDDAQREKILSVRPGITDPTTLLLRREEEILAAQADPYGYYTSVLLTKKVESYLTYVESRSPSRDARILFSTVVAVVWG